MPNIEKWQQITTAEANQTSVLLTISQENYPRTINNLIRKFRITGVHLSPHPKIVLSFKIYESGILILADSQINDGEKSDLVEAEQSGLTQERIAEMAIEALDYYS